MKKSFEIRRTQFDAKFSNRFQFEKLKIPWLDRDFLVRFASRQNERKEKNERKVKNNTYKVFETSQDKKTTTQKQRVTHYNICSVIKIDSETSSE